MRDVTVDELFTWKEEFGLKAKEAFGSHRCYVNTATYSDIKQRCDVIEGQHEVWRLPFVDMPPWNGVTIEVDDSVPDGVLRGRNENGGYLNGNPEERA